MDDLLSTRQLEQLLQVDRITIYRMLDDGRLKGFKVGGQWRFSRPEVEAWLRSRRQDARVESEADSILRSSGAQALPLHCIQAIQAVFAEARDVGAVTTDLAGAPLTDVSNPCAFCALVLSSEEGRARCRESWRVADAQPSRCHAGLLCAAVPVQVDGEPVARAVACQFAAEDPAGSPDWAPDVGRLAGGLGLDAGELTAASALVHAVPEKDLPRIERLLRSVAATYAEIGRERLKFLGRLQLIAEMTALDD